MRILIDLQGAQTESRFRGIGRYSLAFTQALARNAGSHEIWLALNAGFPESREAIRRACAGHVPAERIRLFDIPRPVAAREPANAWRARAAAVIRADFLRRLRPDVILVTSLFEGWLDDAVVAVNALDHAHDGPGTAIILYDLIPWCNPATYLAAPGQRAWYERKLADLRQAGLLLAISEHTRREAIAALDLPPQRIVNISAAADPRFQPGGVPLDAALRAHLGITRRFVLYVPGGFDPRKNIDGLITAWGLLPAELRSAHQLVIVSKLSADVRQQLKQCASRAGLAEDALVLTGYVADDVLAALYGDATLFVFPSRHEGFGLPVLEAMACGAPVMGADNSSIPEVIGRADALFDAADPAAMAACIGAVLRDPARRADLCAHSRHQATQFSWELSARRALDAIEARFLPGTRAAIASTVTAPVPPAEDVSEDLIAAIAAIANTTAAPAAADLMQAAECIAFHCPAAASRQLLLDISEIVKTDARTGIQRVVRSLLAELLDRPPPACAVRPIYFDGMGYRYADHFIRQRMSRHATGTDCYAGPVTDPARDAIIEYFQDDIYLALDLNTMSDAVHACQQELRRRGVHLHFIVYDILLLQQPAWWPAGHAALFEDWMRKIASVADGLICISAAVAADVGGWLAAHMPERARALQISSFHLGADIDNSLPSRGLPDDAATVLDRLAQTPSFLMVGTVEPRKGHAQALAAFEQLWARGKEINLVIVGKEGWLVEALAARLRNHPEQGRRLYWLAGISDEYLEKLYAASRCLIAASAGEGFGLPLIEAARHRLPILARDIPVFREVAGPYASYFSGMDARDLASAIEDWLAAVDSAPRPDAMPWLTWRESARQLLARLDLSDPATGVNP